MLIEDSIENVEIIRNSYEIYTKQDPNIQIVNQVGMEPSANRQLMPFHAQRHMVSAQQKLRKTKLRKTKTKIIYLLDQLPGLQDFSVLNRHSTIPQTVTRGQTIPEKKALQRCCLEQTFQGGFHKHNVVK